MSALLSPPIIVFLLLLGAFGVLIALNIQRGQKTKLSGLKKIWLGTLIVCWVLMALGTLLAFFQVYLWR